MRTQLTGMPREVQRMEQVRQEIVAEMARETRRLWNPAAPQDPEAWFATYAQRYATMVTMAQLEVIIASVLSVDLALAAQGFPVERMGTMVDPLAVASTDGSGRPVMGVAYAQAQRAHGLLEAQALAEAPLSDAAIWRQVGAALAMATVTAVADASRAAKSAAMVDRDVGWVRMLTPPSCARCVILAGKFHRSAVVGFQRHPGCDCTQIPSWEAGTDLTVDPEAYFDSLTEKQQDELFGKAGAQAIRDGADPSQVVNARRGMQTSVTSWGYRTTVTREGTTKRGWASRYIRTTYDAEMVKQRGSRYLRTDRPRLMPEHIYQLARGDKDLAKSLLWRNGYFLDASPRLHAPWSTSYTRDPEIRAVEKRLRKRFEKRQLDQVVDLETMTVRT